MKGIYELPKIPKSVKNIILNIIKIQIILGGMGIPFTYFIALFFRPLLRQCIEKISINLKK